jgi:hypothetical protein
MCDYYVNERLSVEGVSECDEVCVEFSPPTDCRVCVCVCVCVLSWCVVCMPRQSGMTALDYARSDAARGVIRAHMSVSSAS